MEVCTPQGEQTFFHRSFYQLLTLLDPAWQTSERANSILTFKTYQQGLKIPLRAYPALTIGDARWAFQAFQEKHQSVPARKRLGDKSLSTLLYYTYGVSRYDQGSGVSWPSHRFVPSARCLFPAELYLCLPQTATLAAGLYHYDPLHHCLTQLRQGNYLAHVTGMLDANVNDALGVVLISAFFGKTAALYKDFAYRLCTQEAGLLAGNLLLVAAATGLQGQVYYQFLDHQVNQLCGLIETDEGMLAAVGLYPRNRREGATRSASILPSLEDVSPLTLSYLRQGLPEPEDYATLLAFHQRTYLLTPEELCAAPLPRSIICDAKSKRISFLAPSDHKVELAEALRQRNSGDTNFLPSSRSMPWEVCGEILRYVLQPYSSDLRTATNSPIVNLFVVINHVEGLEPGIYRLCAECGLLHVVLAGEQKQRVQSLQAKTNINVASANLVCFLVGDYAALQEQLGDRAYRVLHLETGLLAQRICVMSAVYKAVARYSNSFNITSTRRFLHLSDTSLTPVAELVIGYERPGSQAGQRYRRSLCC